MTRKISRRAVTRLVKEAMAAVVSSMIADPKKEPMMEFSPPMITTRKLSTTYSVPISGVTLATGAKRAPASPPSPHP